MARLLFLLGLATVACGTASSVQAPVTSVDVAPPSRPSPPPTVDPPPMRDTDVRVPIEDDDPRTGDITAPVTAVVFIDLACPACARNFAEMEELAAKAPLLIVYKHYPLSSHPTARPLAEAAEGAWVVGRAPVFRRFVVRAFAEMGNKPPTNADIVRWGREAGIKDDIVAQGMNGRTWSPVIERDLALGERLGLVGVPTVYVNGRLVTEKPLSEVVAEEREKAEAKIRAGASARDIYVIMSRENAAR